MDRLDSWLNAQRGWCYFALLCLNIWPLAVPLGDGILALLVFSSPLPLYPSVQSILLATALSIPGVVPLAGLVLLLRLWGIRYARKHGKPVKPLLTWRLALAMLFMASGQTLSMLQDAEPYTRNSAHQVLSLVIMVLLAGGALVILWNFRYQQRTTMRS